MVRTKADATVKVSAAKDPRKVLAGSGGGGSSSFMSPGKMSGKDKYSGGNSVVVQPVPEWQKGINSFFKTKPSDKSSSNKENDSASPNKESPSKADAEGSSSGFAKNGMISDDDE